MISRKEALDRLELPENADIYEIERRYTILMKRMRGKIDEKTYAEIDRVTEAYDVLTGRYIEEEKPDPKMEKVILGKKRKEWLNIWEYGRKPLLIGLIIAFLFGSIIYSAVTSPKVDMQISSFGNIQTSQDVLNTEALAFETLIKEQNPDLRNPSTAINVITYKERERTDPQLEAASQMKRMLMAAGAEPVDVLLLDQIQMQVLMNEGVLISMDKIFERLETENPGLMEEFGISPFRSKLKEDLLAEGESNEEHVYALDLSEKQVLNSLGLYGYYQYIALCYHGEHKEEAEELVYRLLSTVDTWYNADAPLVVEGDTIDLDEFDDLEDFSDIDDSDFTSANSETSSETKE